MSIRFAPQRIARFLEELKGVMLLENRPIEGFVYAPCGYKKDNVLPPIDDRFVPFPKGGRWGGKKDSHYWFYSKITVDKPGMRLSVRTGKEQDWAATMPQFMVYLNGEMQQSIDNNHTTVTIAAPGEYELYLYAYSGMFDDLLDFLPALQMEDALCKELYFDLKIPLDVTHYLDPAQKEYVRILDYLEKTVNLVDFRKPGSAQYRASLQAALTFIREEFYGKYCGEADVLTTCIGHTHIDVAWLWPMAQTREKAVRSFSTVLALMEEYPEYKFMSSQPQLFQFVKEDAPLLYEKIKQRVAEGRFEVEGGMWVEADCNLISGESMVRQFLHGKRFFFEEFGAQNRILWLPDVFGYSAAMPQILKKCGIDTFVTSKISWNETNQMPFDTFMWRGIDGTEIFSYFLTAQDKIRGEAPQGQTTYNASNEPCQIAGSWDRYQDKLLFNETISTYGYGDGGGGPTREMIENQRRMAFGIPGCPKTRVDTVTNFLARMRAAAMGHPRLRTWAGELYFELHRGTYTSIAKNKRSNRKSEWLLQNTELAASLSGVLTGAAYPADALNGAWQTLLVNQFHDIIPGSSIKEVYEDSDKDYAALASLGGALKENALAAVAAEVCAEQDGYLVFNPNPFADTGRVIAADGSLFTAEDVPPMGYKVVYPRQEAAAHFASGNVLENEVLRAEFNDAMEITRIYDKQNRREVLRDGQKGNVLQAFEDLPRNWDAWDVSDYFEDKMWTIDNLVSAQPFAEAGKSGFTVTRRFLDSVIEQRISLASGSAALTFETVIDWREEHILLKALFPTDIFTDKATFDIQFGTVTRPTHRNTSWDDARFEVCAHKFADVSEIGYGAALLNDCKYGYDVKGADLRLTLLRCPTSPNADADKERHVFTYALYPHKGDHREGAVMREALRLNNAMTAIPIKKQKGSLPSVYSMIQCDSENIFAETVKYAEDGTGLIVRLYEHHGRRCNFSLTPGFTPKAVHLADLMENVLAPLALTEGAVALSAKPFEIITLKFTL